MRDVSEVECAMVVAVVVDDDVVGTVEARWLGENDVVVSTLETCGLAFAGRRYGAEVPLRRMPGGAGWFFPESEEAPWATWRRFDDDSVVQMPSQVVRVLEKVVADAERREPLVVLRAAVWAAERSVTRTMEALSAASSAFYRASDERDRARAALRVAEAEAWGLGAGDGSSPGGASGTAPAAASGPGRGESS